MTIIIEGPDNAGKSRLAEQLSEGLGLPVVHSVRPRRGWTPENALYHSTCQLRPQMAILDRVYAVSEYVYGRIIRGETALKHRHSEALLDFYCRPYLVIYCRPDMDTILNNGERDQMEGVIDNHRKIVGEYDEVFDELGCYFSGNIVKYNWREDNFKSLLHKCQEYMVLFNSQFTSSEFMTRFKDHQPLSERAHLSQMENRNHSKLKGNS